jgi:hypothetical protein
VVAVFNSQSMMGSTLLGVLGRAAEQFFNAFSWGQSLGQRFNGTTASQIFAIPTHAESEATGMIISRGFGSGFRRT